jgi:rieske iron-sulfur protein
MMGDGEPISRSGGCRDAARPLDRRSVVIGGSALLAAAAGLPAAGATAKPDRMPPQPGDRIQIIQGGLKGQVLRPEMLEAGAGPMEAFPVEPGSGTLRRANRLNRLIALRLDPAEMDEQTRARSVDGVLVYSAICTHRACTVNSWMPEQRHLRCHCHLSEFAALSEGSVKSGPARRQLPMVPLGLDNEGFVVALEGFTRKPGGDTK